VNKNPGTDKNWTPYSSDLLTYRFKLFERFCLPSMKNQTNQNFKWLVFFDKHTPTKFKEKIIGYQKWEKFIPCYVDSNFARVFPQIILPYIHASSKYVISTRIDNDDMISKDFIQKVKNNFEPDNLFLNFPNGYIYSYCKNKLYIRTDYSNPFISFIERIQDFKTVWCNDVDRLRSVARIKQIKEKPSWIQVVHGNNVANRIHWYRTRVPLISMRPDFCTDFFGSLENENIFYIRLRSLFTAWYEIITDFKKKIDISRYS
jgi:hypothetical protein